MTTTRRTTGNDAGKVIITPAFDEPLPEFNELIMSSSPNRILIIGLDAATFWLIDPWMQEQKLPTLARIQAQGARAELRSSIPYVSGPAWVSFATGKNPGKHGYFDFARRKPGDYGVELVNAAHVMAPTLWQILSEAGQRVAVMNCPVTYPPRPVNGVLVGDMLTPSPKSQFTYPPELREELYAAVPDYLIESAEASADRVATKATVAANVRRGTTNRALATRFLMEKAPDWDFMHVVYSETDRIMTYLWDDMDPSHPRHDPALAGRFGGEIERHYRQADAILGDLLREVVDPHGNTILFVMSDHGFGGVHRFFFPNVWLQQEGYLALKGGRGSAGAQVIRGARSLLKSLGLAHLARQTLRRLLPGWGTAGKLREFAFTSSVDWSRTRAFWASDNGVTLNVRGREPEGIVAPGAEAQALADEIKARLLALREPQTGERVVAEVWKREEIYNGPYVDWSPDLRVIWQEYPEQRRTHFSAGEPWAESAFAFAGQTGDHARDGILYAYGPGVRRGVRLPRLSIMDLAPTVLWLRGLPVPADMDGRVLTELFEPDFVAGHPVQRGAATGAVTPAAAAELSAEDEEALADRLRGLGYIG